MARLKLDITEARPARLAPDTRARFRDMTDDQVEALAGDADHAASTGEELKGARTIRQLKAIRQRQNLTQDALGQLLRIPVATIRDWEQGRREPDAATDTLLRILEREPDAVRRALAD